MQQAMKHELQRAALRLIRGISILGLSLLFAGCAGQSDDQKVTVRMWAFPMLQELRDHEIYEELQHDFHRENPGIQVQVEMLPWAGRMQKMITAVAGNRAPDAVYLNLDLVPRFVSMKFLRPADEYISAEERADYHDAVVKGVTMEGKMQMFPILRTVTTGLYNKSLFGKAGLDPDKPPATWTELEEAASRITRDNNGDGQMDQWGVGVAFGGDSLNLSYWPLLWQAGGDVLTPDGKKAGFNSPAGLDALQFVTGIYKKGLMPSSFLGMGGNEFASGKLGYWLGVGPMELAQLRKDAPNVNVGVAPVLMNKQRLSYSTIGGFALFKASRHPKETALWLRFLSRPDNMRRICKATNFLPTRKSVGRVHTDDRLMAALEEQAAYCRADPTSIYSRQIMQRLIPEIQASILGKKTPEQALSDAETAVNTLLAGGH